MLKKPAPLDDPKVKEFYLRPGDFLVSRSNTRELVGLSALFRGEIDNCSYPDLLMRFRVDKSLIHEGYLENFLRSGEALTFLQSKASGTSGSMVKINKGILEGLPVPVPTIEEQRKIAQILSTWDQAIEKLEALIAAKQKRKKALMQQLLTGRRRFSGFSVNDAWAWVKAEELFKISSIRGYKNEELLSVTQDQGVLPRSKLERKVVMPEGSVESYKLVEPGDFIISLRSFQGGLEFSSYRGLVSPAYTVLRPRKKIVDSYYKHFFKSYYFIGHLAVAVIGIRDGKQISYEDFSFLSLPYPSIDEQQKIAAILDTADQELSLHTRHLAALKKQKKGLMQQLLTGKTRVPLDTPTPDPEVAP